MSSLLPYSMRDESNLALENCINEAFLKDISKFILYYDENLSDKLLYEKAKMFHTLGIEGWNKCKTREDKINLLKNSVKNHRYKGTIKSIKSVLSNTQLEYLSWQNYNGHPNHYKIRVFVEEAISNDLHAEMIESVGEYKRLSSKMDSFETNIMLKTDLNLNTVIFQSKRTLIQ